jgi:hypothetical protein
MITENGAHGKAFNKVLNRKQEIHEAKLHLIGGAAC